VPRYQQIPAVDLELLPGHLVGIADCEFGEEGLALPGVMNLPAPDVAIGQQCNNCDQDSQGSAPSRRLLRRLRRSKRTREGQAVSLGERSAASDEVMIICRRLM
jgi:hypothetical protein